MQLRELYKIIPHREARGEKLWQRCGTGFTNKDASINIYLDVISVGQQKEITLQLREIIEEDLAPMADRNHNSHESHQRAAFNLPANATPSPLNGATNADIPF